MGWVNLSEIMPYIWIGIIMFAFTAELYTRALAAVWFIPGAFVSFILSLTGKAGVWEQVLLFFIIALILLILSQTIFKKFIKFKRTGANQYSGASVSAVIGETAIVMEEINNLKNTGAVRVNGTVWTAKSEDDDIIYESGLIVTVTGADGAKAVCSR